jgi:hypothetical protein
MHRQRAIFLQMHLLLLTSSALVPAAQPLLALRCGGLSVRMCDAPSDIDDEDPWFTIPGVVDDEAPATPAGTKDAEHRASLKSELLALAAGSCRGEAATDYDLRKIRQIASELEVVNPTPQPTNSPICTGTWELVLSDTQLFRSSPFFMAGRAVCADGDEARRYDWFCDMHRAALAISTIGKVRQIISPSSIVSEFETTVGAVPFVGDYFPLSYSGGLPFAIRGAIVSTASIESSAGDGWALLMDTVEIKGSNVPLLRQALDAGVRLPTRDLGRAIETISPSYANPQPAFRTTYLDDTLRVSRDQDDKLFVYTRVSADTEPTDYSTEPADLGIGKLLSGATSSFFG